MNVRVIGDIRARLQNLTAEEHHHEEVDDVLLKVGVLKLVCPLLEFEEGEEEEDGHDDEHSLRIPEDKMREVDKFFDSLGQPCEEMVKVGIHLQW